MASPCTLRMVNGLAINLGIFFGSLVGMFSLMDVMFNVVLASKWHLIDVCISFLMLLCAVVSICRSFYLSDKMLASKEDEVGCGHVPMQTLNSPGCLFFVAGCIGCLLDSLPYLFA